MGDSLIRWPRSRVHEPKPRLIEQVSCDTWPIRHFNAGADTPASAGLQNRGTPGRALAETVSPVKRVDFVNDPDVALCKDFHELTTFDRSTKVIVGKPDDTDTRNCHST